MLTGPSGTVGFEVLKQLFQKRELFDITVFDVKSNTSKRKLSPYVNEINVVYGNITNENDLNYICVEQDIVIHLAAIIPPLADEKPKLSFEVNTIGTEKLIRTLEKHSPNAFFLYSSSISVYGDRLENPFITINDPLKPSEGDAYAKTKIAAENIIRTCNLDWSILRLSAIMGGHKLSKLMFHQPLNTSLEIATPADTARAFINAIDKQAYLSKKIFNLGGGEDCRISYESFLSRSFQIYGLGKVNFRPKSFAEINFHCGYYADGDVLNNILNFRNDTLDTYFEMEKQNTSCFRRLIISIFKIPIKFYLQRQSEPFAAYTAQDEKLMRHFFIVDNLK